MDLVVFLKEKELGRARANGVLGDPRKAEIGQGKEYLELWAQKMVDFVRKQVDI